MNVHPLPIGDQILTNRENAWVMRWAILEVGVLVTKVIRRSDGV